MKVEILDIRSLPPGLPLRAFVDIKVDGMILRECGVIKENGKRPWIASPQISWRNSDGTIQYKTIVTLPDELEGEV